MELERLNAAEYERKAELEKKLKAEEKERNMTP